MELRQLECFVAVVEESSFTRAAARLHVGSGFHREHRFAGAHHRVDRGRLNLDSRPAPGGAKRRGDRRADQ
ncbi:hypothetical protein GCM10023214_76460 [Amycolatopsis dongchuanensis]|uniref:HTH lysR-type domain-containing protein n=1 Tax=Amycolatopsis dongchuanensis TaxID=1070866 RepID=A0ABP8VRA3_9PSEU